MSKVQTLRAFVNQRLTAAAEEIFGLFERTVAEYEEELCRQRKVLDAVFKPEVRLHRADVWPSCDLERGEDAEMSPLQDPRVQAETTNKLKYEKVSLIYPKTRHHTRQSHNLPEEEKKKHVAASSRAIDSSVIPLMPEQDLSKYIPHYEDRLAAAFCGNSPGSDPGTSRRSQLLDRMRSKVGAPESKAVKRAEKLKGNKNAKRKAKRVEIGWMNFSEKDKDFKQVRSVKGGGTRHVIVNRYTTVRKIQEMAESFFFPNGLYMSLKLQDHACSIRDFSQNEIEQDCTVEDLYDRSNVKMLRLYLFTKRHFPHGDNSPDAPRATASVSPDFNQVQVSEPEVRTTGSALIQESDVIMVDEEIPNLQIYGEEQGTGPYVE